VIITSDPLAMSQCVNAGATWEP